LTAATLVIEVYFYIRIMPGKKKFEFKKVGQFTLEESQAEWKRGLKERVRIKQIRSTYQMGSNKVVNDDSEVSDESNETLAIKCSKKGWSKSDYCIKLNTGAASLNESLLYKSKEDTQTFLRSPRPGDYVSNKDNLIYKESLNIARSNADKLNGSAARAIITFAGSTLQVAGPTSTTNSSAQAAFDVQNYRLKIARRKKGKHPSIFNENNKDTFKRNQQYGDGFNLEQSKAAFRKAKIEALQIKAKTANAGRACRDILTQKEMEGKSKN
jgi:hypothetical protein